MKRLSKRVARAVPGRARPRPSAQQGGRGGGGRSGRARRRGRRSAPAWRQQDRGKDTEHCGRRAPSAQGFKKIVHVLFTEGSADTLLGPADGNRRGPVQCAADGLSFCAIAKAGVHDAGRAQVPAMLIEAQAFTHKRSESRGGAGGRKAGQSAPAAPPSGGGSPGSAAGAPGAEAAPAASGGAGTGPAGGSPKKGAPARAAPGKGAPAKVAPGKKAAGGNALSSMWSKAPPAKPKSASAPSAGAAAKLPGAAAGGKAKAKGRGAGAAAGAKPAAQRAVDADAALGLQQVYPLVLTGPGPRVSPRACSALARPCSASPRAFALAWLLQCLRTSIAAASSGAGRAQQRVLPGE